jgi:hypothetical protein
VKAGIYRNGLWLLDYNGDGVWDGDKAFAFGWAGAIPVVGDWKRERQNQNRYIRRRLLVSRL